VETPNDLDTSPGKSFTTLGLLAWDHAFWSDFDTGWGYRAGQLFAAGLFGLTGYLDDDRQYFMARPLAALLVRSGLVPMTSGLAFSASGGAVRGTQPAPSSMDRRIVNFRISAVWGTDDFST
jgi:hypothetical protein